MPEAAHPFWIIIKALVILAFATLFAYTNANSFDETELKMIMELGVVLHKHHLGESSIPLFTLIHVIKGYTVGCLIFTRNKVVVEISIKQIYLRNHFHSIIFNINMIGLELQLILISRYINFNYKPKLKGIFI